LTTDSRPSGLFQDPSFDRILTGSPLRRPRVAIPVIVGLVVLMGFALLAMFATFGSFERDVFGVFLRGLVYSTMLAVVPFLLIRFLDRRERESPWLMAIAVLWGALIATGLALPLNAVILQATARWVAAHPGVKASLGSEAVMLIGAPIAGPLVEELTKGLGVLALFFLIRSEFDNMRDGFIYGALIGLGFTWLEAPLYVSQNYAQFGFAPWGLQFGARYALFGLSGHAMFTGIFGACLGFSRQSNRTWVRWLAPPLGLLLAIAAHATNNVLALVATYAETRSGKAPPQAPEAPPDVPLLKAWLAASLANLVVFLPFVILVGYLLWRSGKWERAVICEELEDEVGGAITPEDWEAIRNDRVFRTRRIDSLRPATSAALVHAQHELAFRKRRVRDRGGDVAADPLVLGWRDEIDLLWRDEIERLARQSA